MYRHLIGIARVVRNIFVCTLKIMKKEPKRGRPPLPEAERRQTRFQIRVSETEMGLLERASKGRTSTWARKVLIAAANRQLNSK
jgi:hypothetical protein